MESFDETYSRSKTKARKKHTDKRDWLVDISALQLAVAAVGIAVILLAGRFFPASFNSLKAEFNRIMQTDMSVSQIIETVKTAVGYSDSEAVYAGGEDTQLYKATEEVCFAPFDTTVEMCVPVHGRISSKFGYRIHPVTGGFGIHNGTDIAADEGTPIQAAFNGTVEEIGYTDARGNYIILAHGGETKTIYLHCSEIIASRGANVRAGEIIAKVGSTGRSTGPHLHFSIKINGKYCNPEWLMNDL